MYKTCTFGAVFIAKKNIEISDIKIKQPDITRIEWTTMSEWNPMAFTDSDGLNRKCAFYFILFKAIK